jgi:hypothetical protein
MCLQVGADGIGMSDVEKEGSHPRETEVFDEPLGGVETDVSEGDLVVAAFREEAGYQGADLSCAKH